jgi:(p)ppGpp synthase/HD superfamily hydrolase
VGCVFGRVVVEEGMNNISDEQAQEIYAKAYAIAEEAHRGQFRGLPDSRPYFEHCKDVAAIMPTWELKTVAILHDAIEDSEGKVTAASLEAAGIPKAIVEAVVAMTKPKGADYGEYVRSKVKPNLLAVKVKLADNYVNLKDRIAGVIAGGHDQENHKKSIAKYAKGMGILME